jgi:hypothetical protein
VSCTRLLRAGPGGRVSTGGSHDRGPRHNGGGPATRVFLPIHTRISSWSQSYFFLVTIVFLSGHNCISSW